MVYFHIFSLKAGMEKYRSVFSFIEQITKMYNRKKTEILHTSSYGLQQSNCAGSTSISGWLGSRVVTTGLRHRRARVQIAAATLSGNSLRQTVHTHRASVNTEQQNW